MQELERRYRTTVAIITAQVFLILALAAAVWFDVFKFEFTAAASTITALWMAVILVAVGSFVLRRTFFSWERLKSAALIKGEAGLIKQLQTNAIILSALAATIAILGLTITAVSGDKFQMLRASAIALVVCLINFPRRKVWEKIVGSLEKLDVLR